MAPSSRVYRHPLHFVLCHKLHDGTGLLQLAFSQLADIAGADNEWYFREAALSEKFGVAERQQVDNGGSVLLLAGQVLGPDLLRDQRPKLFPFRQFLFNSFTIPPVDRAKHPFSSREQGDGSLPCPR